ncbi:MAG TPA: response regulator [Nocardioides sp.]|nr:response regulator [Nocardioides sp.]
MSVEEIADLLNAVAWPLVALAIALMFRAPLKAVLRREKVEISGPMGFSISARGKDAAAKDLVHASQAKGGEPLTKDLAETQVEIAVQGVEALGRPPRILWVDDRPSNNFYETAALTSLGMHVQPSTSTEDALRWIERGPYDVIISDMGRPPDDQAGYTLLDELRKRGDATPYVIYASSRTKEHFDMAVQHGAIGCTNQPDELVDMVSNALRGDIQYRQRPGVVFPPSPGTVPPSERRAL